MKLAALLISAFLTLSPSHAMGTSDADALEALGKTFAMGFWDKNPEQVLSTVHPDISKKGILNNFLGAGSSVMEELPPDRLQILGRIYNFDDRLQSVKGPRVIIHEIDGNFASIEMVNGEWYDFFHAVKINDEWSLLNCVYGGADTYQSAQPSDDRDAINTILSEFVLGLAGDKDALDNALHINLERRSLSKSKSGQSYMAPLAREQLLLDAGSFGITPSETTIKIHNFTNHAAAAKIELGPWTEQVQLLKINGKWSIVNSFAL